MRLKLFLISSLLAVKIIACSYSPYTPKDTYLYRIMEDISLYDDYTSYSREYLVRSFDFREENLRLWREQTGTRMSDEHLRIAIYGDKANAGKTCFNSNDAFEYLETAKNVQDIRKAMADPWYFPSDSWSCGKYTLNLEELVEKCKENATGVFRGRYVLQALRCLNTLRRWQEAIDFWELQRDSLSKDVIQIMAEREVAAAYHQSGKDSIAADIYARVGDIASLRLCKINSENEMEYVYEHCPDSPYFPEEIQALLMDFDHRHVQTEPWYTSWDSSDSIRAKKFLKFCRRVLYEKKVKNPAIWNYAAAATLDALSRPKESLPFIREGERLAKDEFLRKSFHILKMHVEAQVLPINCNYDQHLFSDLQWICHEIENNMNEGEKKSLRELFNYNWTAPHYYWNDAMRRILLSDVCPRLVAAGRTTRALQLANFADYYLFRKLGNNTVQYSEWLDTKWDFFSYSSNLFTMTDSLSANQLADYVHWQTKGNGAFDRFLANGSNQDISYWYDIVGTHFLREYKYKDAEQWLALLPKGYERNTNIYREWNDFLLRNPFDLSTKEPNTRRSRLETTENYKLNFSKEMVQYEHDMTNGENANIRGKAKVYYAAGLRNQWDYCWALTKYSFSCCEYTEYDEKWNSYETPAYAAVKEQSDSLIQAGLDEIICPELKASLLHAMHRNREVMENYPFTWTAHYIYLNCDTWRDYAYHSAINRKTP